MIDAVRSHASGFIFTTALPPAICAAAAASVRHLKQSRAEREGQQRQAARAKALLAAAGIPVLPTPTHILPVMVRDAEACKAASDRLLERHGIYIQPINPTPPCPAARSGCASPPPRSTTEADIRQSARRAGRGLERAGARLREMQAQAAE